jgi:hypothetical protein
MRVLAHARKLRHHPIIPAFAVLFIREFADAGTAPLPPATSALRYEVSPLLHISTICLSGSTTSLGVQPGAKRERMSVDVELEQLRSHVHS